MNFHKVEIDTIKRETRDTVSFTVKLPEKLEEKFSYKSGQYAPLKFFENGKATTRFYSFSSSPFENDLRFTVKRVDQGLVSNFVNDSLTLSSTIELGEPDGNFVLHNQNISDAYLLIAGGSGITPIYSIINQELHNNPESKFVLVYVNRSKDQIIFFEKLQELIQKFPTRFFVEFYVKEGSHDWATEGRLKKPDLKYFIFNKYSNLKFDSYYVCGSQKLNDFALDALLELNVEKDKIFFELFFVDTQVGSAADSPQEIEVYLPSHDKTVRLEGKDNLLEELLSKGVEIDHSCKSGLCKSCICQIPEGETEIIENFILSDEEIEDNYRLLCLTKSKSESLIIKI